MISKVGIKKAKVFPEPVQAWPLDSLDHDDHGKSPWKTWKFGEPTVGHHVQMEFGGPTLN